jgi:hypothetical protein
MSVMGFYSVRSQQQHTISHCRLFSFKFSSSVGIYRVISLRLFRSFAKYWNFFISFLSCGFLDTLSFQCVCCEKERRSHTINKKTSLYVNLSMGNENKVSNMMIDNMLWTPSHDVQINTSITSIFCCLMAQFSLRLIDESYFFMSLVS